MTGDHEYRGWDSYLNPFAGQLGNYKDEDLSKYSEYKNYTHDIQVMMRFIRSKYNLNFGVMIQPQRSNFIYDYMGNHKGYRPHGDEYQSNPRFPLSLLKDEQPACELPWYHFSAKHLSVA